MQQAAAPPNHPHGLAPGLPTRRSSRATQRPDYRQLNASSDDEEQQGQQQGRQQAAGHKRPAAAAADADWDESDGGSDVDSLVGDVEFEDYDETAWEQEAAAAEAAEGLMGLADAADADAAQHAAQGAQHSGQSSKQQPGSKKQRQQVADGRWVSDGVPQQQLPRARTYGDQASMLIHRSPRMYCVRAAGTRRQRHQACMRVHRCRLTLPPTSSTTQCGGSSWCV
jgi:hypothetical protein